MEERTNVCPCCGRHCDLSAPSCERGEEFARTGVIPEGKGHGKNDHHDEHGGHGGHGRHGEHDHHREHGSDEGHGHHGEHCGHGPHGEHGRHKDHRSILGTEQYEAMDTDNKLQAMIRELGHASRFHFDGKGGQGRILRILSETGMMTQRELTERLGIQPGSASEVIGKLEKAGLIARTASEADRRTADISLTEAGKAQAEEQMAHRKERSREMFSALTDEEKKTLLALLEKLNGSWVKHGHREKN